MSDQRVSIFISYAHEDDAERIKLGRHLRTVRMFNVWDDREIPAGSDWSDEISGALDAADIVLLLVSVDFITSEYVQKVEIPRAIERHKDETSKVIPVLLKPCNWKENGIDHLNALPADEKWVEEWSSIDKALLNVVEGVKEAAEDLLEVRQRRFENREQYRRKVAEALSDDHISIGERDTLDEELVRLGLSVEEAAEIEAGETQTYEEKRTNQGRYRSTVAKVVAKGLPITEADHEELKKRREYLGLTDTDILGIEEEEIEKWSDVERREAAVREATEIAEREAAEHRAAEAAAREAAERAEAERQATLRAEAEREAAERAAAEAAEREAAERAEAEREAAERAAADEAARQAAEAAAEAQAAEQERRNAAASAAGNAEAIAWASALALFLDGASDVLSDVLFIGPALEKKNRAAVMKRCEVPPGDTVIAALRLTDESQRHDVAFGLQAVYVCDADDSTAVWPYAALGNVDPGEDTFMPREYFGPTDVAMFSQNVLAQVCGYVDGAEESLEALRQDLAARHADFDVLEPAVQQRVALDIETRHAYFERFTPALEQLLGDSGLVFLSVGSDISAKKMRNAFERYEVPWTETAVGIIDTTVFGSAKDGMMFGIDGVYMHNPYGSSPGAHYVPYDAMSPFGIGVDPDTSGEVVIGDVSFSTASAEPTAALLLDVLRVYVAANLDVNSRLAGETPDDIGRQRALATSLSDAVMVAMFDEDAQALDTHVVQLLAVTQRAVEAHPYRAELLLDRASALRISGIAGGDEALLREAVDLLEAASADDEWGEAISNLHGMIVADIAEM